MTYNEERQFLLFAHPLPFIVGEAKTDDEVQALDWLEKMTPQKRTELLGLMYRVYANWYNDQQKELARVSGD